MTQPTTAMPVFAEWRMGNSLIQAAKLPDGSFVTTNTLRRRIRDLWVAGDDGIASDWRDQTDAVLWEKYGWVMLLPKEMMNRIRQANL